MILTSSPMTLYTGDHGFHYDDDDNTEKENKDDDDFNDKQLMLYPQAYAGSCHWKLLSSE